VTSTSEHAKHTATHTTMSRLRDVIMGQYRHDMSGLLPRPGDTNPLPLLNATKRSAIPQLVFLFVNPGPTTIVDAKGKPVVDAGGNQLPPINPGDTSKVPGLAIPTYNPVTSLGWRGPYMEIGNAAIYPGPDATYGPKFPTDYGVSGVDLTVLDAWYMPIVLQQVTDTTTNITTVYLVSAGADQTLDTTDDIKLTLYTH
jgi:hypothetical protein